ncbi:hypothetical protein [Streptomyces sp. NPDC051572]|uniref:hypothetical protein n=1 Tax=Streptomyces sp. NPDC051572 TaxID=3155802 RepID=UPI00344D23E5
MLDISARMISDNSATSLRDERWSDLVADLAESCRGVQRSLHRAVATAVDNGETFESLASDSHLSAQYLREAYERFDPNMWAQAGPDRHGREPWRVLG